MSVRAYCGCLKNIYMEEIGEQTPHKQVGAQGKGRERPGTPPALSLEDGDDAR